MEMFTTKSVFTRNYGTTAPWCGMDFGRDKSKTAVCETRNGRLVARYDLPDDPHLRSYRDWFNEEFNKRLSKFFAKRDPAISKKNIELEISTFSIILVFITGLA